MAQESAKRPSVELQRLVQTGFDAFNAGDWRAATDACNRALATRPDMARAHYLAALIALEGGDREMAVQALESTVRFNESHAIAWARLAQQYLTGGRFVRAEECLLNAVRTERGKASTQDLIGTVFRLAGNLEASREWHRKAVESDPGHVPFSINLANSHLYFGHDDEARQLLQACLVIEPHNAQAHWLLSGVRKARTTGHIDQMRSALSTSVPPRSAAYLRYAMGKEYEDLDDWTSAFQAWSAGAAARRQSIAYDEAAEIQLFHTLEQRFTADWYSRVQSDCNDAGPVFIVGEPRTGTTLLDRMLDAHPAVHSAGELRHFGFAVRQVTGLDEPRQFAARLVLAAADADVTAIGDAYLASTASLRGDAPHVIDKLPANYLYLPLILASLPNARILHVRRDPTDTCLAIYKQLFADAYLYSYDLQELARHYVRYWRLMQLWRERFSDRFFEVQYESLVADPEETLRGVLQYIGLSWNPLCLEFSKSQSATATASAAQVREVPHQRSVGKWHHFERQLQPVSDILRQHGVIS